MRIVVLVLIGHQVRDPSQKSLLSTVITFQRLYLQIHLIKFEYQGKLLILVKSMHSGAKLSRFNPSSVSCVISGKLVNNCVPQFLHL